MAYLVCVNSGLLGPVQKAGRSPVCGRAGGAREETASSWAGHGNRSPFPADGDLDEKGSTTRKGNSLKFLGLQIRHKVGGAGSTGRWLKVAQWVLWGLVTIKTQTSYAAYSLHTTFLFHCLHHILNNYRNLFSREIKVADNFIDHCKNLLIDVSSL